MKEFDPLELKKLYTPPLDSHKGQNGKLFIIAGSGLFHAPAIWTAEIASRIVDMVYVSSTQENNEILQELKGKFWNGIVVRREDLESYVQEADCVLIGPGLPRKDGEQEDDDDSRELTKYILTDLCQRPKVNGQMSKVVIDGGALQCMDVEWIPKGAILTPHKKEFFKLCEDKELARNFAEKYKCIVLLKSEEDIVCSPRERRIIKGGNAGMTKGGTGDVLAGLVAALACKNDPFLAACAGSYINKAAGDALYKRVGYYYNSSDLLKEIPKIMKKFIISV